MTNRRNADRTRTSEHESSRQTGSAAVRPRADLGFLEKMSNPRLASYGFPSAHRSAASLTRRPILG
jgi:hypothetical protein